MKIVSISALILSSGIGVPSAIAQSQTVAVESGIASFYVTTNIPALEVSGKSNALQARVQIRRGAGGVTLERIEAWMPVSTLLTGMALRDEHMRKRIFTTAAGELPDLRFEGGEVACPGVEPGREATCKVSGTLAIRGVSRGFTVPFKIRQAGNGSAFRASGEGLVKLSDYGIEQPSQLGVKTANEVKLRFELNGKEGAAVTAVAMGRR
jgi:polyisoprenoid-binding protein YceI